MNPYAAAYAVACLVHNDSPVLWPGRHQNYIAEWTDRWASMFA